MDRLISLCEKKFPPEKVELLKKAERFAREIHDGQKRESLEPYYVHPEAVAIILFDMEMDADTIIAGILHDTIEDGMNVTIEQINSMFGKDIARMVDGVTKLTNTNLTQMLSREDRQAENLRKMFLAIANDIRVVIIKLADRLHNMRTLGYCSREKQVRKAKETMDVYAPLADRFGMGAIKVELEDLSFGYLMPEECRRLQSLIEPKQEERMSLLKTAMHRIETALNEAGIKAEISGRRKHIYSIYRKLNIKKVGLNELYDLVALRVIVDNLKDCYGALGIIHSLWRPVPGRFKDYIAMPKTNMYRSLHTTLFSDLGMPFEVQIRTQEMHRMAEYGIAAHWMYKEGRSKQDDLDKKLEWLHQLVDYDSDASSSVEYIDNVRHDFFTDYVFVLTPNGEIFDLPVGSTPVDFAYRIHSNVGDHTQHAKVNGVPVKLDYKLKTHDVVEITTSPQASPSRDWLNFVKTSQAKNRIKQWFKKANRDENIARGRDMLSEASRRQGQKLSEISKPEYVSQILSRLNMNDFDDVLAAIGYGGLTTGQVLNKLMEAHRKARRETELIDKLNSAEETPAKSFDADGRAVIVKGEANMVVRFAHCCSPLPGDKIFGYITRGRGVSIHSENCPNAAALKEDAERIIGVGWADEDSTKFPVSVHIIGSERPGLMADITMLLLNLNINMRKLNAKTTDDGRGVDVSMSFDVKNVKHLDNIQKNLMKIEGVHEVTRTLT
ncbi:MAG: bifunctional (p)ppGpp synthetase/guanosine-3',5'-bis(diphosphate) 3'-pyrophosphohydrolase [Clostridia bacterium]|nr:bifunctional (p)ppGpp synthetase/guanosine-3',5'-bis(diphosphate) 3'-pyrophosphohydrolase [Clostridia bacterium]